ncbi:MAG: glutamate--tRNA ligase [Proteobacteria bacterium]|nr:glutamate--tRNA ligase [Pseudomonadota bacterium]
MAEVKTRFAPSPTGFLHIGGARTALFNWLYARHFGGTFVLRIEDTDAQRSTQESVDVILEGMKWLGLDWDEGPFYQSERRELYLAEIEKLLAHGKAYRCYCSREELDEKRTKAMDEGKKPKYDGTCRDRTSQAEDKSFTIRFRAPETGKTVVDDMIKGKVVFDNGELDDLIIARSDGSPTYNFVVVVDDATMGITHILRGDDHLNNTPRQIQLYDALGYTAPVFGHMPLILGQDKKRLSKRHGATSVMAYKDMGYLPEAMINFLARLGWSHGDQEIFSKEELIRLFDADNIGKSAGVFNEEKLLWLNAHYIKSRSNSAVAELFLPALKAEGYATQTPPPDAAGEAIKERAKTTLELEAMAKIFYSNEITIDEDAATKFITEDKIEMLSDFAEGLKSITPFTEESISAYMKSFVEERGIKMKNVGPPIRIALTGTMASPDLIKVIKLLGQVESATRIRNALKKTP